MDDIEDEGYLEGEDYLEETEDYLEEDESDPEEQELEMGFDPVLDAERALDWRDSFTND